MISITPFLMFNSDAEDAVKFYISLFKNSEILKTTYYGPKDIQILSRLPVEDRPGPEGSVKTITFTLNGRTFRAGNGGARFKFNHGVSMYVRCETQPEIDDIWNKIAEEGSIEESGWVCDKYGVPWQVAPSILDDFLAGSDEKSQRASAKVLSSKKMIIDEIKKAYFE